MQYYIESEEEHRQERKMARLKGSLLQKHPCMGCYQCYSLLRIEKRKERPPMLWSPVLDSTRAETGGHFHAYS